jgi:hypothetical protein
MSASSKKGRNREWNDYLSVILIVRNNNFPLVRIIEPGIKQYLINELPRVLIGVIQSIKLVSAVIGDAAFLGRQVKIETRHQLLHHNRSHSI